MQTNFEVKKIINNEENKYFRIFVHLYKLTKDYFKY